MSLFAKNLRFLRKQRSLNQEEVSVLFKKRANTIGNWENGKSEPSIGELIKLADYFKVGLQQLLHSDLQKAALEAMDPAAAQDIRNRSRCMLIRLMIPAPALHRMAIMILSGLSSGN